MRRDWKLIRAVLRQDKSLNSEWPKNTVAEHMVLCEEAGYIHGTPVVQNGCGLIFVSNGMPWLTLSGADAAAELENEADLNATLAELDAAGVGHVSTLIFEMMRRKAKARLSALANDKVQGHGGNVAQ